MTKCIGCLKLRSIYAAKDAAYDAMGEYLRLERELKVAEDHDEADEILDKMDVVFYELTEKDIEILNERGQDELELYFWGPKRC